MFLSLIACLASLLSSSVLRIDRAPRPGTAVESSPARREPPLESYRALREMRAKNGRYKLEGWIDAWTEMHPQSGFSFGVVAEGGSGYIRDKVLRKVLESERQAVAGADRDRAALTSDNYVFGEPEPEADGLLRIRVRPKRKDTLLVDGWIVVTETDRDLVRIEGRLAKPPSFWTRRVDIVRTYGRIEGHRVPIETTSVARVLMAGESSFSMRYTYERINGTVVGAAAAGGVHQELPRCLHACRHSEGEASHNRRTPSQLEPR